MQLTPGTFKRIDGEEAKWREPYFRAVYDAVRSSISSGGVLRGSAFWRLTLPAWDVRHPLYC